MFLALFLNVKTSTRGISRASQFLSLRTMTKLPTCGTITAAQTAHISSLSRLLPLYCLFVYASVSLGCCSCPSPWHQCSPSWHSVPRVLASLATDWCLHCHPPAFVSLRPHQHPPFGPKSYQNPSSKRCPLICPAVQSVAWNSLRQRRPSLWFKRRKTVG